MPQRVASVLLSSWLVLGCGSGASDGTRDSRGSDFAAGGGAGTAATGTGGNGESVEAEFRFGVNLGHPNASFSDSDMADLASAVGVRSIRLKYPQYHFTKWGQDIEVQDAKHYASLGMGNHAAFVIGMSPEHSTAPSGATDWERDQYTPKNLYEPIFDESGGINQENYFAAYLAATFETYAPWVTYWEIFNEPDWVSDYRHTQSWESEPPGMAGELVRFHGSIFDYIRMLRIASVVRDRVAPGTFIMTGGLGYPGFLDAIVRYTDNPEGGEVTEAFPNRGGSYFDIVSFHHYPHLVEEGNSDAALVSLQQHKSDFERVMADAGVTGKRFMITETGAAHRALTGSASGSDYARNYLQKAYVWAKTEGVLGIDWFTLSDGSEASDPFEQMGLYQALGSLSAVTDAVMTDTGVAYRTTGDALATAKYDQAATKGLVLPANARGFAFERQGRKLLALWATVDDGEAALAEADLDAKAFDSVTAWDGKVTTLEAVEGRASVSFGSSPVFVTLAR